MGSNSTSHEKKITSFINTQQEKNIAETTPRIILDLSKCYSDQYDRYPHPMLNMLWKVMYSEKAKFLSNLRNSTANSYLM